MDRIIIAVGGGELRNKTTLPIDREIARLACERAGERRGNALFFPTASYDSLPYFNTFRKTYTSECGMKADVALLTKKDIPTEKILSKIEAADLIYVGGGNTMHLMRVWERLNLLTPIRAAYERGCILAGLSAGAICWFQDIYTDSDPEEALDPFERNVNPREVKYSLQKGFGWINAAVSPHFNSRPEFVNIAEKAGFPLAYAIEDNAAAVFINETYSHSFSAGGEVRILKP